MKYWDTVLGDEVVIGDSDHWQAISRGLTEDMHQVMRSATRATRYLLESEQDGVLESQAPLPFEVSDSEFQRLKAEDEKLHPVDF